MIYCLFFYYICVINLNKYIMVYLLLFLSWISVMNLAHSLFSPKEKIKENRKLKTAISISELIMLGIILIYWQYN